MRTAWKLKGMTIHTYVPCNIRHVVNIVTGVDSQRMRIECGIGVLVGTFRITGMHNLDEERTKRYVDDTVLIGLVEQSMGISFHEVVSGLNLSDGYFTLSSETTLFDPAIIRRVLQSIDCTKLEKRAEVLFKQGVVNDICNPCPMHVGLDMFEATCPRCCEDWGQRAFERLFLSGKSVQMFEKGVALPSTRCPECRLPITPYL